MCIHGKIAWILVDPRAMLFEVAVLDAIRKHYIRAAHLIRRATVFRNGLTLVRRDLRLIFPHISKEKEDFLTKYFTFKKCSVFLEGM